MSYLEQYGSCLHENLPHKSLKLALSDATAASPISSGSKQNSPMEIEFPVPEPLEIDFPANTDIPMETGVQIVPENVSWRLSSD